MSTECTLRDVCDLLRQDDPKLLETVDQLLGISLICSPIVFGPAALPALGLLGAKNELTKIGKRLFDKLTAKRDKDPIVLHRRMLCAYTLTCCRSFFEAMDRSLPGLCTSLGKPSLDTRALAEQSRIDIQQSTDGSGRQNGAAPDLPAIHLPHPVDGHQEHIESASSLFREMAAGFQSFVERLQAWQDANAEQRKAGKRRIDGIPALALEIFSGHLLDLVRKYDDFYLWAQLYQNKQANAVLAELSDYAKKHSELFRTTARTFDVGFSRLAEVVASLPGQTEAAQANQITESLRKYYLDLVKEAIIDDPYRPQDDKPALAFPPVRDAFVPQRFRVIRQTTKERRLEREDTWDDVGARSDLGAFLLTFLRSPYSTDTPLVILGHPGCGKSLLTKVLSAALISKAYTPIRVPLREVDADAPIANQILQQISAITKDSPRSWAAFADQLKARPIVLLLDGYDELLQASGKVYAGYLRAVQNFQHEESVQGRPIRVIVTSRITLIDKATIPLGSSVLRLLEFDSEQEKRWIDVWNAANSRYFVTRDPCVEPFAVPEEERLQDLAKQPLLLFMLALYDSDANQLRQHKGLDRTRLYDSLLRRFIERERNKSEAFRNEPRNGERQGLIDRDMRRLGIAAIGMYNRRKLHVRDSELNRDISFFEPHNKSEEAEGRALTQADMLLGSFFFVHRSRTVRKGDGDSIGQEESAFEFLHNTFGEFLTADFVLHQALEETLTVKELQGGTDRLRTQLQRKLDDPDGLSKAWYASLMYTPLHSRPVVLDMMREWIKHCLERRRFSRPEFLACLDRLVTNQIDRVLTRNALPEIMRGSATTPFGDLSLLGHAAIYTLNLVILRTLLSNDGYEFREDRFPPHEDGTTAWDQLVRFWQSWFSLDNMNGLTAILSTERHGHSIVLKCRDSFQVRTSADRLETVVNVARAVGDNTTLAVAGLLAFKPLEDAKELLTEIERALQAADIDLPVELTAGHAASRLLHEDGPWEDGFLERIQGAIGRAAEVGNLDGLAALYGMLEIYTLRSPLPVEFLGRLQHDLLRWMETHRPQSLGTMGYPLLFRRLFVRRRVGDSWVFWDEWADRGLDSRWFVQLAHEWPEGAAEWLRASREMGLHGWPMPFDEELFERVLDVPRVMDLAMRRPDVVMEWIRLGAEVGAQVWLERVAQALFERLPEARQMQLIAEHPDVAMEWVGLAREMGHEEWAEAFAERALEEMLRRGHEGEWSGWGPVGAVEMLRLSREIGKQQLTRLAEEMVRRVLRRRHISELVQRRPDVALEWIRHGVEVGGQEWIANIGRDVIEHLLRPRVLNALGYSRSRSRSVLVLLQVVSQVANVVDLRGLAESAVREAVDVFLRMLQSGNLERFLVALRVLHLADAREVVQGVAEGGRSLRMIHGFLARIDEAPIGSLSDIRWFADVCRSSELRDALKHMSEAAWQSDGTRPQRQPD